MANILYFGKVIYLPGNNIAIICSQIMSKQCFLLDLRINSIQFLLSDCFSLLKSLRSLSLANNKIKFVESNSFHRLNQLKFLNLSSNPLWNLASFVISNQINGIIFSTTDVNLTNIETNAFLGTGITVTIAQNYHICCLVTVTYFCSAQQPWYVSCTDIFSNIYMRLCYILISTLIIFHNVFSIIINISSKKNASLIISFINISHLMLAMYLIAILVGDYTLQSSAVIKEQEWRSAPLCLFAFGSILYQTMSNQLLHIFLSLSRVMVVLYPIDSRFKEAGFVYMFMSFLVAGSFLTSVVVTLMFTFYNDILTNNLCLPFVDPTGSIMMIKVIIWGTATSQSITLIILASLNVLLIKKLDESRKYVDRASSKENQDQILKTHIVISVFINFISWFPMNGIFLTLMFLPRYPLGLVAWAVIFILPLNSIITPIIVIFNSVKRYEI